MRYAFRNGYAVSIYEHWELEYMAYANRFLTSHISDDELLRRLKGGYYA